MADRSEQEFECVDPGTGRLVALRDGGELSASERTDLADHLLICDSCRLQIAAEDDVIRAMATPARFRPRLIGGLAAGLAAACLAGILILPPVPDESGLRRSGTAPGFLRPVEGEVVVGAPALSWRPVAGATAYNVELSQVGTAWSWRTLVQGPKAHVPVAAGMPLKGKFRGVIRPVPADLADPIGITVGFSRDTTWRMLGYRLTHAPLWLRTGALIGLGGVLGSLVIFRRRPRLLQGGA